MSEEYTSVVGIFYPPAEARARFIEVGLRRSSRRSATHLLQCPVPVVQSYFGDEQPENLVVIQGINGVDLRFPLQVWYSPTAFEASHPVNEAIWQATLGSTSRPLYGPVVVLKYRGTRRLDYADTGTRDYTTLSAYFLSDGEKETPVEQDLASDEHGVEYVWQSTFCGE
ncbi:hypothetical protein VKT23_013622 [Stygiomarasmius scandens]|uniref:Uncharacterized protein n=1 Tax=Marasmiellus scandens TaxID=2682957 RepID=A0ABR1J7R7_9AGAR